MFEALATRIRRALGRLRIAVVTPVGPGHAALYKECRASAESAWRSGHGPFSSIRYIAVDDGEGRLGRSRARNIGIERAVAGGADWLFFLDADDLMAPEVFESVAPFVRAHDAVWGLILGLAPGAARPHLRIPQIIGMDTLDDLLLFDPFLTLQMGHFVRAPLAQALRFDESMDAGEDFDYYLRAWSAFRCVKVAREFFINRHALHSTGPRAASAENWGIAVRTRQTVERERRNFDVRSETAFAARNARAAELQKFCRQHGFAGQRDCAALSRQMPFHGEVEVHDCEGGSIVLHTENDDAVCAQLAWTGEYQPFASAIWQAVASAGGSVLDIGSGNGLFALLAWRAAPGSRLYCFDPAAENAVRLRENVALNRATGISLAEMAIAGDDGETVVRLERRDGMLPADAVLAAGTGPNLNVPCMRLDTWLARNAIRDVKLVRIRAGGNVMGILDGMGQLLGEQRPDLLIDLMPQTAVDGLEEYLRTKCYSCYGVDDEAREMSSFREYGLSASKAGLELFASARTQTEIQLLAQRASGRLAGA